MKNLKLFSLLLLLLIGVGQVWAGDETATIQTTCWGTAAQAYQTDTREFTDEQGNKWHATGYGVTANTAVIIGKGGANYLETPAFSGNISSIEVTWFGNANYYLALQTTDGTELEAKSNTASPGATETFTVSGEYTQLRLVGRRSSGTSNAQATISKVVVTYAGGGSDPVAVTGVSLNKASTSIVEGKTETLVATVAPSNASDKSVSWSSDDESVATVDGGIVTAVAAGTATITVTTTDGSFTDECEVTVTEAPAAVNYEKVTEAPEGGWSGEYLIVYEPNASTARVWTGEEASNCYVEAEITAGIIAQPEGTASVTIAEMTGGYSIQVNGGTNDGKYIQNNGNSNGIKFVDAGVANTLAYENSAVTITCNSKKFRYNSTSGQDRFRYFGSDQQVIQLYKKVDGTAKPSAGLAFDAAQKLAKVGGTLTAPNLSTADGFDGTVTYASSDEAVVKVNASTGAITEVVAAGKAVITAHSDETENFKEGSASYTIFVAEQAGTAEEPLTEASAKALIDLGCEMEVHVHGTVLGSQDATKFTVTLAGGMQFYKLKDLGNVAFESAYIKNGDEVTAVGTLTKYNTTYELAEGCYLTAYTEYTEPLVDISNTKETAYTVAQALALATNPTSDLTKAVYIAGVVYDVKSFNSTNGTLDIYIKDEGVENKFEFYKCAGIYDESLTAFTAADDVQVGDEVIGYGVMKYFSGGSIWEFDNTATGDYLVELTRPDVPVSSVSLPATESVEVGSTVTLTATVLPANASDKSITWTVESGSDKASVADGVVTGLEEGEAVIRATSVADGTKYAECTVTVVAADPTKHVVTFDATVDMGESPLSKSNISMACSNGALSNGSEYRLYKSSTTTFECSVGNITKIEFTGVSGNPVSGFGDPEVGTLVTDGNNGVWTGNAASVSFVASGAQVRATEITVTYKEDNRAAAELAWDPAEDITLTVGDAFTAPTLLNPNTIDAAEISIESSNTAVATVTAGVVALVADATGTATITATFAGNEDYKPAVVSYTITVNEAGLDNVTFDATQDIAETGELSISKSGFTLGFTSGALDNGENYRLYKSQTMTLSSTDYLIKKIEFTCTSGNPISGFANAEGLDKANNQWTGETNSVELTASNAQVRIEKLKVYYIEDTRAASGLAWSANEVEITLGDAFTPANLVNPNSIDASAITIASDNTDLAVVNDGVVSLVADAMGTAHITATFAGNETYKPATISYTIIVNDPTPTIYVDKLNVNFGTVATGASVGDQTITVMLTNVAAATATLGGTNPEAFSISPAALTASGGITISFVGSTAEVASFAATITITDDASVATQKVVNLSLTVDNVETAVSTSSKWIPATAITDGMIVLITGVKDDVTYAMGTQTNNNRTAVAGTLSAGVFTPGASTMPFTVVAQDDGTYALRTSAGQYLYAASSSGNHLKTQSQLNADAKWTLSTTSAVAEGSSNRNVMQFNGSSKLFACYSSASQSPIALYVKQPKVIDNDATETAVETGDDVTVKEGGVLTINNAKQVGDVVVEAGGTVSASSYQLTVKDFTINTQSGKSGQLLGTNVNVTGNLYLEIKLRDGDMDAEASRLWYCISAPFDVNMNGGFFWGDGTPMVLNTHFQLFEYDGQKRANTGNGWKRVNGTMKANTAYFIGFDDAQSNQNTIKLKANAKTIPAVAPIALNEYSAADEANANWNAVANPTLRYVGLDKTVQVFDPENQNYNPFPYFDAAYAFVVGTPFFYKGTGSIVLNTDHHDQYRAPQHRAESYNYCVQISKAETERFDNQLYVVASETAAATYEEGQDVPSMNEETSKYGALIWTENYGDKRLAIEEAPLVNSSASYVLGIYAPEDGEYTISTPQAKEDVSLYLTREGRVIWDLTAAPYTLDLTKGNTTGYGLRIVAAPKATTDLEDVQGDKLQCTKVLINNHVFILRGEQLYDATGRLVK